MLSTFKLPTQLRQKVDAELEPGERIKWIEQPTIPFLTGGSLSVILFGLPWTGFALVWVGAALGFQWPDWREGMRPEYLFALFGLPFIFIGLLLMTSPFWEWKAARYTVYVLTDRRALLIRGVPSLFRVSAFTIRSFLPSQLHDIYRKEHSDGTGDVIFGVKKWQDSDGDERTEEIGFTRIRQVREVEQTLKELAKNS